jgi:hypothetical protein
MSAPAFVQKWVRLNRAAQMLADRGIPVERVQDEIISAFQSGFKQLKFPEMPPILASDRSWRATPQLDFEKSTVIAICKSCDPRERPQPRPVIVELSADEINRLWPAAGIRSSEKEPAAAQASISETQPAAPAKRMSAKQRAAHEAIKACFPEDLPNDSDLPNKLFLKQVAKWLTDNRKAFAGMSNRTILRVAGRAK